MKFIARIQGRTVPIDVEKDNGRYQLTLNGKSLSVDAIRTGPLSFSILVEGRSNEIELEKKGNQYSVFFYNDLIEFELYEARKFRAVELTKKSGPAGPLKITAPMPGKIVRIMAQENSQVSEGEGLLIMEAMKMQNEIKAPRPGVVRKIHAKEGEPVSAQQILMLLE